jgi:hypothetical protein
MKKMTTSSESLSVNFYLAEDLREEQSGLVTAVGLYPDRVIVANRQPGSPEPSAEQPVALKSLGFLFNICNLKKASPVSVDIVSSGKVTPFMSEQTLGSTEPGKSLSMIGIAVPMLFTSFGRRKVIVKIGKEAFEFEFEIRDGLSAFTDPRKKEKKLPAKKSVLKMMADAK